MKASDSLRVHFFQHVPEEGLGCIADWLQKRKFCVSQTSFFAHDRLPRLEEIDWLIVMGGPMGVADEDRYPWLVEEKKAIEKALQAGQKVLGVCLGAQLIASVMGAHVYKNPREEIGWFSVERVVSKEGHSFLSTLPLKFPALHWHGDTFTLPSGALHLARSKACEHQAFSYKDQVLGLQFHLEMDRATLTAMLKTLSDRRDTRPYIQSREEIERGGRQYLPQTQGWMVQILEAFEGVREAKD